jgi:hypothetical protein
MSDSDSDVTDNAEALFDHRQKAMRTFIGTQLTKDDLDDKILANIFIFWREEWARRLLTSVKASHGHGGMRAPFVLAAVCRRFRHVAQDTPALWSFIYINFASRKSGYAERLFKRLPHMLRLSKKAPLTICIQDAHAGAYSTEWFPKVRNMLEATSFRWTRVIASFSTPDDLAVCWGQWPLSPASLSEIQVWGSANEQKTAMPATGFLDQCRALKRVEFRNIEWRYRPGLVFSTVTTLDIGPSLDLVLGQTCILQLLRSFPAITRLRLLAFPETEMVEHAQPLDKSFTIHTLTHLTVSPVLLRTSLQGFEDRRVLPALMSVSVHFHPGEEEDYEGDTEHSETARRNKDLATVGRFLQSHITVELKLRGLDKSYSPSALCTSLFRTMITSKLKHITFEKCTANVTEHLRVVLTRVSLYRETSSAARVGRVPRVVPLNVDGGRGSVYLLPSLESLYVIKCSDVEWPDVVAYVREAPRNLKEFVVIGSDIDRASYREIENKLTPV